MTSETSVMISPSLLKSLSKQLKYYVEVKKLEDGFDLSGPNSSMPLRSLCTSAGYTDVHDSTYKRLVNKSLNRIPSTYEKTLDRTRDDVTREKKIHKRLQQEMENYEFLNTPVLSMYYLADGSSRSAKLLKRRATVSKGTGFVGQNTSRSNVASPPATARLVRSASRLIVAADKLDQQTESNEDTVTNQQNGNKNNGTRRSAIHRQSDGRESSRAPRRKNRSPRRESSSNGGEEFRISRQPTTVGTGENSSVRGHNRRQSGLTVVKRSRPKSKQDSEPNLVDSSNNNSVRRYPLSRGGSASSALRRNGKGSSSTGATAESPKFTRRSSPSIRQSRSPRKRSGASELPDVEDQEKLRHSGNGLDSVDLGFDGTEADAGSKRSSSARDSGTSSSEDGDSSRSEDSSREQKLISVSSLERKRDDNLKSDSSHRFDDDSTREFADEFFDHPLKRSSDVFLVLSSRESSDPVDGASSERDSVAGKLDVHHAARTGNFVSVVELVEDKPDLINHRDNDGITPLHLATIHNYAEIVKFLCAKASDLDILSFSGYTALQFASMKNHIDCIKVLHNLGAAINLQTAAGQTALHLAATSGHIESVRYLVEKCGALDVVDTDKCRAADLAERNGHIDVVRYLRNKFGGD